MTAREIAREGRARGEREDRPAKSLFAPAVALALMVGGCSGTGPADDLGATSEYFAESEYGVKASPRVAWKVSGLPRGGGRQQVGKPYQIKGKWYQPKEDPGYVAEGAASWYGEAFHGRLTANGEVYDMTHLTAAHPTMPLPSYARVTNLANGSSVLVRVNDRGPFAHGRIIDLSKRAAEMLDYKDAGVASVRVEYVGPAPLHGQDDGFLLASYRPSGDAPGAAGVMIAMNGPTPSQPAPAATAVFAGQPGLSEAAGRVVLPSVGPIVPTRPTGTPVPAATDTALLSYAARQDGAQRVFDPILRSRHGGEAGEASRHGEHINLGTWASREEAERLMRALAKMGSPVMEEAVGPGGRAFTVSLLPDGSAGLDEMLRAAWAAGAADAFTVRR